VVPKELNSLPGVLASGVRRRESNSGLRRHIGL
jgi:hypothetical protein